MRSKVDHARRDLTRKVLIERLEDRFLLAATVDEVACSFNVDTTADVVDSNDSVNSLREAITCANSTPGPDTITVPAGTYTLTITGADEDANQTGDLDITDDLTITGADQSTTIIQAGTTPDNG